MIAHVVRRSAHRDGATDDARDTPRAPAAAHGRGVGSRRVWSRDAGWCGIGSAATGSAWLPSPVEGLAACQKSAVGVEVAIRAPQRVTEMVVGAWPAQGGVMARLLQMVTDTSP